MEEENNNNDTKEEPKKTKKSFKTNKKHWQIFTVIFVMLFIISIITAGFRFGGASANYVKSTIEELSGASVTNVEKENGLYRADILDEEGNQGVLYMSKDGSLLFQGAIDVEKLKEYISSAQAITGSAVQEPPATKEYSTEDLEKIKTFITCLEEKEFKIYGANWCGWTKKLVEDTFGGFDIVTPIYVECTENKETCDAEEVSGYPTIKISGENYQGARTFEDISKATGCEVPDIELQAISTQDASCE